MELYKMVLVSGCPPPHAQQQIGLSQLISGDPTDPAPHGMPGLICIAVHGTPGGVLNEDLLDGKKKETVKGPGLFLNDIISSQ